MRELVKCGFTNLVNFFDPLSYLCLAVDNPVDNLWITLNKTPQEPVAIALREPKGELEVITS